MSKEKRSNDAIKAANIASSLAARKKGYRTELVFKESDFDYLEKWRKIPGDTNIGKIKTLIDCFTE